MTDQNDPYVCLGMLFSQPYPPRSLSSYIDESRSWAEDAALVLQERTAREYEMAMLWREEGCEQLSVIAQNEAMGMAAHGRVAYARFVHQAPDQLDLDLTVQCWARAKLYGGI